MKRNVIGALLGATVWIGTASASLAEDVALVMTNRFYSGYANAPQVNAMRTLGPALNRAGFNVVSLSDFDMPQLTREIDRITRRLEAADRLLIILGGHTVETNRDAWLLATDAGPLSPLLVGASGVSIGALLDIAATRPGTAVVAVASSRADLRTGPGVRKGFDPAGRVPEGVTVLTGAPNNLAILIETELLLPGQTVANAIAAAPSGVNAYGYFAPTPLVPLPGGTTASFERSIWTQAETRNTVEGYQDYLRRFPSGQFVAEATRRITLMQETPEQLAQRMEAALGLNDQQRRAIQRDLTVLGFDTRGVDGLFGSGTRRAIRGWQTDNGFPANGFVSANQISLLQTQGAARAAEVRAEEELQRQERERLDRQYWAENGAGGDEAGLKIYLERYPQGLFADAARQRLEGFAAERRQRAELEERQAWDAAQAAGTLTAYEGYLARYPNGRYVESARAAVASLTPAAPPVGSTASPGPSLPALPLPEPLRRQAEQEELALNLSPVTQRLVEIRLNSLGLAPGIPDGVFDNQTRGAIVRYQQSRRLPSTGYLNQVTVAQLLAEVILR